MGRRPELAWPWLACLAAPSLILSIAALPWRPPFDTDNAIPVLIAAAIIFGIVYSRRGAPLPSLIAASTVALAAGMLLGYGRLQLEMAFVVGRYSTLFLWAVFVVGYAVSLWLSAVAVRHVAPGGSRISAILVATLSFVVIWVSSAIDAAVRAGSAANAARELFIAMVVSRAGSQSVYAIGAFVCVLIGGWFVRVLRQRTTPGADSAIAQRPI